MNIKCHVSSLRSVALGLLCDLS